MELTKAQKNALKPILAKYKHTFRVADDATDLRAMGKNYSRNIIPSRDIGDIINALLDTRKNAPKSAPRKSIDPRTAGFIPKFALVDIDMTAINPLFQRDVAANHIAKIERHFDPKMIIIPCAIKDPVTGMFLIWDGHHTARVLERQGWSHIPVWYVETDVDNAASLEEAEKALVLQAGRSFLTINKQNKRPVSQYDEHYVGVECGEPTAAIVENIVNSMGCKVARTDNNPGNITHVANLYRAYDMQDSNGTKGVYLKRSLNFCRKTWPHEAVQGVTMLAMALLYQKADLQTNSIPDAAFDAELGKILTTHYGSCLSVYEEIREEFLNAWSKSSMNINEAVCAGIVQSYKKHGGKVNIGNPDITFAVR